MSINRTDDARLRTTPFAMSPPALLLSVIEHTTLLAQLLLEGVAPKNGGTQMSGRNTEFWTAKPGEKHLAPARRFIARRHQSLSAGQSAFTLVETMISIVIITMFF